MRLTQDQYDSFNMSDEETAQSFGRHGIDYLWSDGEMPVSFDSRYPISSTGRTMVEETMTEMNKELCGCFRFR